MKIDPTTINYNGVGTGQAALDNILFLVYSWAGIVGVIILVMAGFFFVTARGDAAQMKRAKDAIRGAVIGLVVVMIAFVVTRFILGGLQ